MQESRNVNSQLTSEIEGMTRERDQMIAEFNAKYFELEVNICFLIID